MKNITICKKGLITRVKELDFTDDGTRFRAYLYKGLVPITVATNDDYLFLSIRLDYILRFKAGHTAEYFNVMNRFNGIPKEDFRHEKLLDALEDILQTLVLPMESEARERLLNHASQRMARKDVNRRYGLGNSIRYDGWYMAEVAVRAEVLRKSGEAQRALWGKEEEAGFEED